MKIKTVFSTALLMVIAIGGGQAQTLAQKTITEADCTVDKLGTSIPASAIGEPVAGITLTAPRWNAAGQGPA